MGSSPSSVRSTNCPQHNDTLSDKPGWHHWLLLSSKWMRAERGKLSRHADVAKAMNYMLKRWEAFTRFLDDGRICLTNNAAERALRGVLSA